MILEQIIPLLRKKEKEHQSLNWEACKQMADILEDIIPKERVQDLRCPYCGGLTEVRGKVKYCFSCHFEFNIDNI